jgi:hypothetical protein
MVSQVILLKIFNIVIRYYKKIEYRNKLFAYPEPFIAKENLTAQNVRCG